MSADRIIIFDTTLRDGEQSPGCSMNTTEKLEVARALVELGVDVIEAGFPIASPGDFEAVERVAREFGDRATICALARCRQADVDRAWQAVQDAGRKRIHVFLATSAIHREHKLKMDKATIVRTAVEMVERARGYCDDIEFSPEDAARTELDFLCEVVEKAIAAGATTINIPDTVGYAVPTQYRAVFEHLRANVPNINQAVLSAHCHDDLGLAVANSLAAIDGGARQIECTINGLGERAGNAALEEVVMAIRTRADYFHLETGVNTRRLAPVSSLVSGITGMKVQRNKAIVGQNAFAHEAGIHQHGILQERTTYEIMRPEDVGYVGQNLVLGKHSGRHAFRERVTTLGYDLPDEMLQQVFDDFIALADKKKEVYDSDISALIENRVGAAPQRWTIVSFQTVAGKGVMPTAGVVLRDENGQQLSDAGSGGGPLDALFQAIERITEIPARLEAYHVHAVSGGKDALAEVSIEVSVAGRHYHGKAISTDTIEASAEAFLKALNKVEAARPASGQPATEAVTP